MKILVSEDHRRKKVGGVVRVVTDPFIFRCSLCSFADFLVSGDSLIARSSRHISPPDAIEPMDLNTSFGPVAKRNSTRSSPPFCNLHMDFSPTREPVAEHIGTECV